MRAIAVLFVLVWHAGVPWLPGGFIGVDVFFVISGFLMTGILHRELMNTGTVSIAKFYARRARRLIPASALTLVVTGIATWLILPPTRWWSTGQEIAAAGAYVVNWLLASGSTNYLAQDAAPSAVQHFWSLSVEEQYYLVWPVVIVGLGLVVRRFREVSATKLVLGLLVVAFVVSFGWSVLRTPVAPGPSYFVTTTRIWELALGGIVAMTMATWGRLPRMLAVVAAWSGVAVVLATAMLLPPSVPFPGWIALIPTLAVAVIIAAGPAAQDAGPVRVCRNVVVQKIGAMSYSLYLWHWPVLVIGGYLVTGGISDLSVTMGVLLVLLSVIPAALSYYFVEVPIHTRRSLSTKSSLQIGALGIVVALVAGGAVAGAGLLAERSAPRPVYTSASSPVDFGAQRIGQPGFDSLTAGQAISPSPLVAADDNPPVYARGCQQGFASSEPVACEFGNLDSETTVALIGDSHASHWVDAMEYVAQQRGWRLITFTKSSCALIDATVINRGAPAPICSEWNAHVMSEIEQIKPAAVFTSNIDYQVSGAVDNHAAMVAGMASAWTKVTSIGIPVFVLRDTPASGVDPADCLAGHLDSPNLCATDRASAFGTRGLAQLEAAEIAPVKVVDVTAAICPRDPCSPVIGDVMVYRDRTHMTATYSRSLGPTLDAALPNV
ncbi:acyltransferase [Rhodococcus sp. AD45-ID]|uniref:acyltransferase family protein n=1 Tax=unclassified Rhodococcus (in: high G+C Gram-positive bacteria) TaxID=192944 RepID=UPI0005D40DB3|nr:O-acetyltransferase OatA [Rhodococcus sp. AD45]PSR41905.1 acyltransferase [Rhodococcus sp. AD45-ID]